MKLTPNEEKLLVNIEKLQKFVNMPPISYLAEEMGTNQSYIRALIGRLKTKGALRVEKRYIIN